MKFSSATPCAWKDGGDADLVAQRLDGLGVGLDALGRGRRRQTEVLGDLLEALGRHVVLVLGPAGELGRARCRCSGSRAAGSVALVRPWTRWKADPVTCAIAWTIPRNALPKAMPAIVAGVVHLLAGLDAVGSVPPGAPLTDGLDVLEDQLDRVQARPSVKSFA